ncbi:MAG: TIGR02996 domain-containing protein [Myxococcota bacterium]|nr:TIGR02996 domain-containing protein [Deltaproteobacteria bacterium]MDQ3340563.1 TIGR02996 domain-containing protein [Myxococcota bacterium]
MAKKKTKLAARTASPEERAFLASILANPDDKKARLVYADLLQEQDDPRGAFIVMQCTRAELADGDERIAALDEQIAALLAKHKKTWTALGENKGARWEFRRGFVEKLSLDAAHLLKNADAIFAAEPIEELSIWKIDESATKIGKSPLAPILKLPLHRVRRLSLARQELVEEDIAALASAKTLGSVELLDLTNGGSEAVPLAGLAKSTSLPKLRELRLGGCMMGDEVMAELAKSKTLRFARLVAVRNDFSDGACEAIANATWAPHLEELDLSSNELIGNEGLSAIACAASAARCRATGARGRAARGRRSQRVRRAGASRRCASLRARSRS